MLAREFILEYVFPVLGIIVAQVMFTAPCRSVQDAVQKGSLGILNPTPWAMMTGNCAGWVAYSYLTKNIFVLLGNMPGLILSFWLNMCAVKLQYHDYSVKEIRKSIKSYLENNSSSSQLGITVSPSDGDTEMNASVLRVTTQNIKAPAPHERIFMIIVIIWCIIFSIVGFLSGPLNVKVLIIGLCANVNTLFFYAAPLSSIFTVVRTRSSDSIHRWTMIMNTTNGAFWTVYGFAVWDLFIFAPNSVGTFLGILQIILCFLFPRSRRLLDPSNQEGSNHAPVENEEHVGIIS